MRKDDERVIIETTQPKSLLATLKTLRPISEEFPLIAELVTDPIDL